MLLTLNAEFSRVLCLHSQQFSLLINPTIHNPKDTTNVALFDSR